MSYPELCWLSKGVPLLPLYTRGAGLHDGVLVGYGIGVLVGYNCTSCIQGRSDSIFIPVEASCSLAEQVVHVYPVWSHRTAHSLSEWLYWAAVWIPRATSST